MSDILETKYHTLRALLQIDRYKLTEELIQHPSILMDVNEATIDAMSFRDQADGWLALKKSDAGDKIRNSGEKKPPETAINAMILQDEDVQDAMVRAEEAKQILARWNALVGAYMAKGSMLKRLAELTIAGFLAPNSAGAPARKRG